MSNEIDPVAETLNALTRVRKPQKQLRCCLTLMTPRGRIADLELRNRATLAAAYDAVTQAMADGLAFVSIETLNGKTFVNASELCAVRSEAFFVPVYPDENPF